MKEPMKVCLECKEEYEPLSKGGIMLHICETCRAKPQAPPRWIETNRGLLIPNVEALQ